MENTDIPNDLKDALDSSQLNAVEIVNSFTQHLKERESPKLIYHYTNDIGLKGIVEGGKLWMSDIFNLNDPSELRHGISFAAKELKSKTGNSSIEAQRFAERFSVFCQDGTPESAHYFTCSFSTDGNDLGQWRAYADNGCGYALGFDAEALAEIFLKEADTHGGDIYTFPMTYKESDIVGIYKQLIDNILPLISLPYAKNLGESQIKNYIHGLLIQLSINTLWPALFFKHEAYKNESEFRFLQIFRGDIPAPNVKWRHRAYELVKYREFAWRGLQPGILKHIVVGPAADQHKATRFANDCLKAFHKEDVEIRSSGIPFRAV